MQIHWSKLSEFSLSNERVEGPWTVALESFGAMTHLRLTASGRWHAVDSMLPECGPNGLLGIELPDDQLVLPTCRFCALLGKIGGSSAMHTIPAAGTDALAASQPFAIGTLCVLEAPKNVHGPLFIGFNTSSRAVKVDTLTMTLDGARPSAG